ncbi:CASP-like protein 10-like, partial [Trifolium pratense]
RYLVLANGICAGYSLLSAVLVAVLRPNALRAWTFFFLDQ